jgi:D-alanyl-D-alanine dipeptidase
VGGLRSKIIGGLVISIKKERYLLKELKGILMSDPLVSAINVSNSQELFVNLVDFNLDIVVDPSLSKRSPYFSFVRESVAKKLVLAKMVLPKGIRFLIKEGFRPTHVQQRFFEHSLQRVKRNSLNQEINYLIAEASKYTAPPNVAPHPTGGAIDLTLIDSNNLELDLGTPFDAIPQDCDNATFTDATNISDKAIENRQILVKSLQSVGFVNYFTEWWHWSYGDKYWAVVTSSNQAIYNPVSEHELSDLLKK